MADQIVDSHRFAALEASARDTATVRKYGMASIQPTTVAGSRAIRFVVSDGSVDRDNDTIDPNGWDLTNYRANPVVLFAHDSRSLPIASTTSVGVEHGALVAVAEFDTHPMADTVFGMLKRGVLRATSVGFRALEYAINAERGGVDFKRQELLEFSVVPIPANPHALMTAAADGVDLEPLRQWVQDTIEAWPTELKLKGKVWDKLRGVPENDEPESEAARTLREAGEFLKARDNTYAALLDNLEAAALALTEKRGRVLSASNEGRLRTAADAITDVLNTLPQPIADDEAALADLTPKHPASDCELVLELVESDAFALDLADDDPDIFDIDPTELREALRVVIRDTLRASVAEATTRTLNQIRGRLD